jgi:tripartite-type tricarboxylate transporter receptor subunit TctC
MSRSAVGKINMKAVLIPLLLSAGLYLAFTIDCAAQTPSTHPYPVKPIRLIHGYAAGSSMDLNARSVAQKLGEALGQQVIVDSRPGATGVIAAEIVMKSPPDGYTLLAAPGSALTATPYLQKVPFDPVKDFTAISPLGDFSFLLAGHPALPAKNARELIVLAKARPGILSYGSNGVGSAYHIAGALFASMAQVKMLHVPYRGGGSTAITDLVSGRVDMMWNNPAFLLPQVQIGKLKALGVTGIRRIPAINDVPTIGESGLLGYEISGWQGLLGPAGLPKDIVTRLHGTLIKLFAAPDMQALWESRGMEFTPRTPEHFAARLRNDYETYGKLIKQVGDRIE